jgi:hypothetical protein
MARPRPSRSNIGRGRLRLTLTTESGLLVQTWVIDERDLGRIQLSGDKSPKDTVRRVIEQYLPVDDPVD